MSKLQVKLHGEWRYVFAYNIIETEPIIVTDMKEKALGCDAIVYFQEHFADHEFRCEPAGKNPGWTEAGQMTVSGKIKAPEHVIASTKRKTRGVSRVPLEPKRKQKWTGREWLQGKNKWKEPEKIDQSFDELLNMKWYEGQTDRERYLESFGIDIVKEAEALGITLEKYEITPIGVGIVMVFKDATSIHYYIHENREYRKYSDQKLWGRK